MHYIVELTDDDGRSCKISLSIPWFVVWTDVTNSTWRVLDEGFVRFRSGGCEAIGEAFSPMELRLVRGNEYGIQLFTFTSKHRTINSSGEGHIHFKWCVSFKSRHITWALIE